MAQNTKLITKTKNWHIGLSALSLIAFGVLSFSNLIFNPLNQPVQVEAAPGTMLSAGVGDATLPTEVLQGRTGTDIRFKTNIGNTYYYSNGPKSPGVTITDVNPAETANTVERQNRLMTSRHDLFVYHDGYAIESVDTTPGTYSYNLKLFCAGGCVTNDVNTEIEVLSIVNQWDSNDDGVLDQTDTLTGTKGIDTSVAGELNISVTPFGTCAAASGTCAPNSNILGNTVAGGTNFAGQFGFITVVFALKSTATVPTTNPGLISSAFVIDGTSSQDYSAAFTAAGNGLRMYVSYLPENDELDQDAVINTYVRGADSTDTINTYPVEGDTSYKIVVRDILGAAGGPLTTGTCSTTVATINYTGNVTNGVCIITVNQPVPTTGTLVSPVVTVSDGDAVRPLTTTDTPDTINRFSLANIGTDGVGNTGTTSEGLTFSCDSTTSGEPTDCRLSTSPLSNSSIAAIIPATTVSPRPITIEVGGTSGTTTGVFDPATQDYIFTNVPVPSLTGGQTTLTTNVTGTIGNLAPTDTGIVGTITVGASPITPTDLTGLAFACGTNNTILIATPYLSTAVPVTTCTGVLPTGTQLDVNNALTLRIGNIGMDNLSAANRLASDTCTASGLVITCLNVPVGSLTAAQILYARLGTNTATAGYGVFTNTLQKMNVYADGTTDGSINYGDATISYLKGLTGTTSAYNNILHKDWRTGVSGNEARIQLNNYKGYTNLYPGTNTKAGYVTPDPIYTCVVSVRPAGSTGAYTDLRHDANNNGIIEAGETSTSIPYNTTTNSCAAVFTNANFRNGTTVIGQPGISSSNAKIYNWDVKIDVVDTTSSTAPFVASTFNTAVGFKFAAIIPGG